MILFDPDVPASLNQYGILIPLNDNRTTLAFEALKKIARVLSMNLRATCSRLADSLLPVT